MDGNCTCGALVSDRIGLHFGGCSGQEPETTQSIFIPDAAQEFNDAVWPHMKESIENMESLMMEAHSRTILTYAQKLEAGIIVPPKVKRRSRIWLLRHRVRSYLFYWKHYLRDFWEDKPRWQ